MSEDWQLRIERLERALAESRMKIDERLKAERFFQESVSNILATYSNGMKAAWIAAARGIYPTL